MKPLLTKTYKMKSAVGMTMFLCLFAAAQSQEPKTAMDIEERLDILERRLKDQENKPEMATHGESGSVMPDVSNAKKTIIIADHAEFSQPYSGDAHHDADHDHAPGDDMKALQATVKELNNFKLQMEGKLSDFESKLDDANAQCSASLASLQVEVTSLRQDKEALQAVLAATQRRVGELDGLDARVGDLDTRMDSLTNMTLTAINRTLSNVSFSAGFDPSRSDTLYLSTNAIMKFSDASVNTQGVYNPSTGKFSAPFSGTYFFSVNAICSATGYPNVHLHLMCDGVRVFQVLSVCTSSDSGHKMAGNSAVVSLSKGSKCYVQSVSSYTYYVADKYTNFNGFLLAVN